MTKLKPKSLQNASDWDAEKPTIVITPVMPEWKEAYQNWKNGKNPTDSKEWKRGVFLTFMNLQD